MPVSGRSGLLAPRPLHREQGGQEDADHGVHGRVRYPLRVLRRLLLGAALLFLAIPLHLRSHGRRAFPAAAFRTAQPLDHVGE